MRVSMAMVRNQTNVSGLILKSTVWRMLIYHRVRRVNRKLGRLQVVQHLTLHDLQ